MILLVLLLIVNVNADAKISGNFSYCHQTDQILEFDFERSQLFNAINVLRIHVDEFQEINFNGNSLIVYVNNGQLYSTTCVYINELSIPSKFDRCVYDLPVYFWKENIKNTIFLTKSGILRNTSSMTECSQEPIVFKVGKNIITMINKTTLLNEKRFKSIQLSKYFEKNYTGIRYSNESYSFYDYYFQNFAKNKVFITIRDIIEYIFMVIVAAFFKNKYVNLIGFLLKNFKKMKPKFFNRTTDIKNNIIDINLKNKDSVIIKLIEDSSKKFEIKEQPINLKYNNNNSIHDYTEKRIREEGSSNYNKNFEKQQMNFNSKNQINEIMNPTHETASAQSGCKSCKDCKNGRCPCKRVGVYCTSHCHNGTTCQNQH
jgi:hypothetical protein